MAGKNGKEVGRISLRVLPNLDGFRRKVEQGVRNFKNVKIKVEPELDKFERKLQEETKKFRRAQVHVTPEIEHFKQEVERAAREAGTEVHFGSDFDSEGLSAKASLAAKLASHHKVWFRADLDTKAAMLKAAAFSKVLQESLSQRNYRFDGAVLSMHRALDEAGALKGILEGSQKILKDWGGELHHFQRLLGNTYTLTRKTFNRALVGQFTDALKLARNSAKDMAVSVLDNLKPFNAAMNSIRGMSSLASAFGAAMATMAGSVLILNGAITGVSAVVGYVVDGVKQLSRVALLIPGILGGAGMIGATLFTGFRGLGKALSTAVDTSADLEAELGGLAPSAADFARALREITPAWSEVRKSVQDRMFKDLGSELRQMSEKQLPTIRKGMEKLATSTNLFLKGFGDFATHTRTTEALNKGFASTDRILGSMSRSIKPLLLGLQDIGVIGLDVMAKMSTSWPKTMERFAKWTNSEEGQEKIRQWIDDSIEGFKDLGATVGNLYETFKQIGNAFGIDFDSSALEKFRDVTESFREWVGLSDDANSRISRFSTAVKNISAPWIEGFKKMWDHIEPAFQKLRPVLEELSATFAEDLAEGVANLADWLGRLFDIASKNKGIVAGIASALLMLRAQLLGFKLARMLLTPFTSGLLAIAGGAWKARNAVKLFEAGMTTAGTAAVVAGGKLDKADKKSKGGGLFGGVAASARTATSRIGALGGGLLRMLPWVGIPLLLFDAFQLMSGSTANAAEAMDGVGGSATNMGTNLQGANGNISSTGEALQGLSNDSQNAATEVESSMSRLVSSLQQLSNVGDIHGNGDGGWFGLGENAFNFANDFKIIMDGLNAGIQKDLEFIETAKGEMQTYLSWIGEAQVKLGELFGMAVENPFDFSNTANFGAGGGGGRSGKIPLPSPDVDQFNADMSTANTAVATQTQQLGTTLNDTMSASLQEGMTDLTAEASTLGSDIATSINEGMSSTDTGLSEYFANLQASVETDMAGLGLSVTAGFDAMNQQALTKLNELPPQISTVFNTLGTQIATSLSGIGTSVSGAMNNISLAIINGLANVPTGVQGHMTATSDAMVTTITDACTQMNTAISAGVTTAVSTVGTLPGQAQAALGNTGSVLYASGQALVQGFINGINSKKGEVGTAAAGVAAAARAYFPFSPAKKGPFSGKGYTTHSGKALVKDFTKGMLSEESNLDASTAKLLKSSQKHFGAISLQNMEGYQRKKILDPVLESNAEKIARWREREAENLKKSNEKIDKINSKDEKSADKAKKVAEEKADLAKRNKESYKELLESLEAPDYSDIDRSFNTYWIEGLKSQMNEAVVGVAKDMDLVNKSRAEGLKILSRAKKEFGNVQLYPGFDLNRMEGWLKSKEFGNTVYRALEEANIGAIPIEFAVSNIDQLRSDLNMGDGVISRAIDAGMDYNYAASDMKYERDNKVEIHYHVADMNEAIRLEKQRERKQMMKMKR